MEVFLQSGTKMNIIILTTIFSITTLAKITIATNIFSEATPEDAHLNFTALGIKYGHPVEEHDVITEDGYILTIFHIPGRRNTPVLIMHGTADHADTFIMRGKKSLAITLADAGFDVWVGNLRGNKYARRHIKLNPDTDPEFWDFSFHEPGFYDLPASIDYVLKVTGEESLQTIGHSQGTTNHYVLLSTRPEYNKKIKLFIALAPVAFLNNLKPPVSTISEIGPAIDRFAGDFGVEEFPGEKLPLPKFNNFNCGPKRQDTLMCSLLTFFYLIGFDMENIEPSFFQVLLGHYPGTTSRKTLGHFNQVALSKRFSNYDYGREDNIRRYGSEVAPEYNLREVKVKTAMLVGREDKLATVKDSNLLRNILPNVVKYHLMKPANWNHIDFIWRKDMNVFMFPVIINLLDKYN